MTDGGMFARWCALNAVSGLPAAPADVAKFIADIAPMGIDGVWQQVGEISRAHYMIGLADPTLGGLVSAAVNEISKIDPPRSWPKDHKFRFEQLPYDLQVYLAAHEAQREKVIRRAQNDVALARQGKPPARESNGNSEQNAAA
jgi:hypothetical protein